MRVACKVFWMNRICSSLLSSVTMAVLAPYAALQGSSSPCNRGASSCLYAEHFRLCKSFAVTTFPARTETKNNGNQNMTCYSSGWTCCAYQFALWALPQSCWGAHLTPTTFHKADLIITQLMALRVPLISFTADFVGVLHVDRRDLQFLGGSPCC